MALTDLAGRTTQSKLNSMAVDVIHDLPDIAEATYSNGDLMAEQETITDGVAIQGGCCILQSICVIDKTDSVTSGITLVITSQSTDFGTVGSAPSISAGDSDNSVALVEINNFTDIGSARIGMKSNIGICMKASASSRNLNYAVINSSGGDIVIGSGEDIEFKFGIVKD
jgi:hypothetical protein